MCFPKLLHCLQVVCVACGCPKFPASDCRSFISSLNVAIVLKQLCDSHKKEDHPVSAVPFVTKVVLSGWLLLLLHRACPECQCKLCASLKFKLKTSADGKQISLSDDDLNGLQTPPLIKWLARGTCMPAVWPAQTKQQPFPTVRGTDGSRSCRLGTLSTL